MTEITNVSIAEAHLTAYGAQGRWRDDRAAAARCDESGRHGVCRRRRPARRRSGSHSSASRTARSWTSWSPAQTGTDYELSPILEPLEPYREHLTIVSGLRNKPGETPEPHAYIESTWLSCVKPWDHGVAGPDSGVTADQMAARHIGQDTRLPSLELTTSQQGARLAWRTPTQSLPQEGNPRAVFQKLFGQGDTDAERAAILHETGSILDRVKGQASRLQASLGVKDRVVVSDYLDSVREIERRVQMASQAGHVIARDSGCAGRHAERHHRALQADVRPDGAGVPGRHHPRDHLLDGPRSEHADLHEPRHRRRVPPAVASRQQRRRRWTSWCRSRATTPRCSRSSSSGWRRRRKGAARCSITRRSCSAAT